MRVCLLAFAAVLVVVLRMTTASRTCVFEVSQLTATPARNDHVTLYNPRPLKSVPRGRGDVLFCCMVLHREFFRGLNIIGLNLASFSPHGLRNAKSS